MRIVLATLVIAVLAGYLFGGRLSKLATLRIRWPATAIVALALQGIPVAGRTWPLVLLFVSLGLLLVFVIANLRMRAAGFPLVAIGILLNFTVIAVNQGMPVTREALVASHQTDTLESLIHDGGAKHHLAASGDRLLFLADVIPIAPLRQAVSVGDVFTYLGVIWLVVAAMLGRATPATSVIDVPTSLVAPGR
ncbi:MAG TPA: DUF5317 family protein [Actinomycetota bacterium]